MIKILFVRTSIDINTGGPVPPSGVLYLSSYLKKYIKNIDTRLFEYYFYGTDEFIKEIKKYRPDVVAFSSLSCEKDVLFTLSSEVKKINSSVITVSGGPYPTVSYDEILKSGNIDFAVIGEGEITFLELIEFLFYKKDINLKNTAYIKNSNIFIERVDRFISDLDSIPFPDWGILDIEKYFKVYNWNGINKNYRYMPLLTSRGCPYGCKFCHNVLGKKFRKRSIENIISEIEMLKDLYDIKEFHIIDDVFNYDLERAKNFFSSVYQRFSSSISFSFPNGLRADRVDDEMISIFSKAGCYKIYFGIESASDKIRNEMMNKGISIDLINRAIRLCLKNGIIPAGYFIFGYPGETKEDIEKTFEYIKKTDLVIAHFFKFSDYSAIAGTKKDDSFFTYQYDRVTQVIINAYITFYSDIKRLLKIIFLSPYRLKAFLNICNIIVKLLIFKIIMKFRVD